LASQRAAHDYTSQQFIGMQQMGTTANASLGDQNVALKNYMKQFKDFDTFFTTLHNTPLGSVVDDARAQNIWGRSPEDIAASAAEEKANKAMLYVDPKQAQTFTDLYKDLDLFGQKLEQVATVHLSGFAGAIDSVVKYLMHAPDTPQQVPGHANPIPWGDMFLPKDSDMKKLGEGSPRPDGMPAYATGAYSVPNDGTAMLHQNELVMPAKEASAFRDMLANTSTEGSKDFGEFNKQLMASSDIIVDLNRSMKSLNDEIDSAKYLSQNFGGGTSISGGGGTAVGTGGGGGSGPHSPFSSSGGGATQASGASADMSGGAGSFIKHQEGLSLKQYNDAGHTAIGYGHDFTASELAQGFALGAKGEHISTSGNITKEQADSLFTADYQSRFQQVSKQAPGMNKLNSNQQEAVMSYYYNTGRLPSGLEKNIESGNMAGVSESLRSGINTVHGVPNAVLTKRRAQEASLFNTAPVSGGSSTGLDLSDSKDWSDHLANMKNKGLLTDQQCVTLAMASVGVKKGSGTEGGNVHDWRRGESASEGNLTPGTPVSTFLDRAGKQSNLYAGGGAGTPGAHLDHAAVFEKYLRDQNNKITGMIVNEQYQGSHGVHQREYDFGKGWGEGNASNYSRIALAHGGYLGGENDPMTKAARGYEPKSKTQQAAAETSGRVDSYGRAPTPHLGDMSQFHKDTSPVVTIFNKSGSNVNLQTASLGAAQGNFSS
jgi:GH24 family phage-related lysozyme (muramidase)